MTSSDRTEYFERLVELRVRDYAEREPAGFLSIEDAMIYAGAVIEASAIEGEPGVLGAEADDGASPSGRGTILCTVAELRAVLERWPDVAGSAGGPAVHGDKAAD